MNKSFLRRETHSTTTNMNEVFKLSKANDKLAKLSRRVGRKVRSMSLKAGYSCPGARDCLAKFDSAKREKIIGPETGFVCFAASLESIFGGFDSNNWHNFKLVTQSKSEAQLLELILRSLATVSEGEIFRVHIAWDFLNAK